MIKKKIATSTVRENEAAAETDGLKVAVTEKPAYMVQDLRVETSRASKSKKCSSPEGFQAQTPVLETLQTENSDGEA